ncbi:MAG: C10 family peptidase [Kiritimatiellae bacterium]|nr:C10 family peptidase [Kiritimatiellia bacterium]
MMLAVLFAIAVSSADAVWAVRGWTREGGTLAAVGAPVSATARYAEDGGKYFSVKTTFGTVFVAGDTSDEPIIAFTGGGEDVSEPDENSPLAALLARRRRTGGNKLGKWNRLLSNGAPTLTLLSAAATSGLETSGIGDMRVEPLVKSKWDQGSVESELCYNYYTPENCVCGCVAAAMAQVMRYHEYPTNAIEQHSRDCKYANAATNCTMIGGVYDWEKMPLVPDNGATEDERKEIGKLAYDAGVATYMQWGKDGSGTYNCLVPGAMSEIFGYKSTVVLDSYIGCCYPECGGSGVDMLVTNNLETAVFSNLDAGYPVLLGIENDDSGHCVVGDGYGFNDGDAYVHLNMGWSGQYDLWYNLPDVNEFDDCSDVVYNIIPGETRKATLSGRVTYGGSGVGGLTVGLYRGAEKIAETETSEYGVYGFAVEGGSDYIIKVALPVIYAADDIENVALKLPEVEELLYGDMPETCYGVIKASKIGNSWGNDIELEDVIVAATEGNGGGIAIPASWFTNYYESAVAEASTVDALAVIAGQTAANGVNSVAECYVALLDPTNENSRFVAYITFDDDSNPQIDWSPKDETRREYVVSNSSDLAAWKLLPDVTTNSFFKVGVKLK